MTASDGTDPLDRLLTPPERQAIRAPITSARTFPAAAYTSAAFLELELARVFHRHWVALCFSSQVGRTSDVLPVDAFGVPLVATRDDDGELRVFHNVCPYDGHPVATEARSGVDRMQVAYHGWEYDLSGTLRHAPIWNGHETDGPAAVPEEGRTLAAVPSREFLGVVFVALSADVGPFDEVRRSVIDTLQGYDLDTLTPALDAGGLARVDEAGVAANWKTFAENDCLNVLHEGFVHGIYRSSSSVPRTDGAGHATFRVEHHGLTVGFSYDDAAVTGTYPEPDLPPISSDGTTRPDRGHFLQLFPNLSLMVRPNYVSPLILHPTGPASVAIATSMLVRAGAEEGAVERLDAVQAVLDEAGVEDAAVIEAIQRARRSPVAGRHFYSPFWDRPHHRFNQMVLDALELEDLRT